MSAPDPATHYQDGTGWHRKHDLYGGPHDNEPAAQDPEGWGVIRPGDRKAHYYRKGMSLCRRVGFYSGPLNPVDEPSPDDHAECRKLLDREKNRAAK